MRTNGSGANGSGAYGKPIAMSAKQRDDQRLQIIAQLNANTLEIGKLIDRVSLFGERNSARANETMQLRADLDALGVAHDALSRRHEALLVLFHASQRPWYARLARRLGF